MPQENLMVHLSLALDSAQMAQWESIVPDGSVERSEVIWSERAAALLGFPPKAFRQSFQDFLARVHPDDRDSILDKYRQAAQSLAGYQAEYRVVWPDQSIHWLAAKACFVRDHEGGALRASGIVWDITDHKNTEIALAEQKELAEVTLSSIGDGVITTDANGRTQSLNRVAEQLTGWPADLAKGKPIEAIFKVVDETSGELFENVARKCMRLGHTVAVSAGGMLVSRDGREIPLQDSASPILARDGRILGAVVVFHDVSHERQLKRELSWQASHDMLTGLINRRQFEAEVAEALASAQQEHDTHALLFLDLDQFKIVNDTCGHVAGDELLRQITTLLQSKMRDSDVLARLGGDELGVLLHNCPVEQAHYLADNLRQSVKDFRFVWGRNAFEVGASIGLVTIDQDSKSLSDLLSAADQACYVAKEQGRNRVHFYQESDVMLARRHGEMLWVSRLNEAFEKERFTLFTQSIVSLNGGPRGPHAEVLVRMVDGNGLLIPPGAFIPAAERYDLMPSIDRWVIERTFRELASRNGLSRKRGLGPVMNRDYESYAINLSGMSLNDKRLLDFILEQFAIYEIAPRLICFEITEAAAIGNLSKAKYFMDELKKVGCQFSLDDFGSGLSSFAYLRNLPVDFLKIDGSFIRDIATDPVNRSMVSAINQVGHVMGIKTIAEYVENDSILESVQSIGIDYAQGYAVGLLQPLVSCC
jgi:diguanylate cyclase (GGDEF)-like protein/PAS domain S-box-containing protein